MLDRLKFFYGLLLLVFVYTLQGQGCPECKTVVSANSSANYNVGIGEVLCINPGVTVTGLITLNGGNVCNRGTVANMALIEGTFDNYGVFSKTSGNLTISNAKNLRIICHEGSNFGVTSSVNMSALSDEDSIVINISSAVKFSVNGDVSINKGWLKVTNCIVDPGSRFASASIFNIGGQFNVSSSRLKLLNLDKGIVNVRGAINVEGKFFKTINNYGTLNCNNTFNITGNAQNTGAVIFNNYGDVEISDFLNLAYNNGSVIINNFQNGDLLSVFSVGRSITISKDNNGFNNYAIANVAQDVILDRGTFFNSSKLNVRDFTAKFGTLNNSGYIYCGRNFILSNQAAVVNNNNRIDVTGEFNSTGTVNFGKKSVLLTRDFTHLSGGTINGAADLLDSAGVADSSNYALIDIIGNSDNNGYLRQYLVVYDETFTGSGLRLNNYHNNASRIAAPPVIIGYPPCPMPVFAVNLISIPPSPVCAGTPVTLKAVVYNIYSLNPGPVSQYIWLPSNAVTTPPTNTYLTPPVTVNTTFGVKAILPSSCFIQQSITISVSNLTANAGPDQAINPPPNVTIGGTPPQTGGVPPYTYAWTPTTNFVTGFFPTQSNPKVNPPVTTTYILTVTDSKGCTSSDKMLVYLRQTAYAVLKKELDGGFFDVTAAKNPTQAGKLNFKYEEEYLNNGNNLKCTVIKMDRTTIPVTSLAVVYKDNRYTLNLGTGGLNLTPINQYYILEVVDKKGEKTFLRFKY